MNLSTAVTFITLVWTVVVTYVGCQYVMVGHGIHPAACGFALCILWSLCLLFNYLGVRGTGLEFEGLESALIQSELRVRRLRLEVQDYKKHGFIPPKQAPNLS